MTEGVGGYGEKHLRYIECLEPTKQIVGIEDSY